VGRRKRETATTGSGASSSFGIVCSSPLLVVLSQNIIFYPAPNSQIDITPM
jgi:ATP/ADP translocase